MTDQNIDPTAGAQPRGFGQGYAPSREEPGAISRSSALGSEPTGSEGRARQVAGEAADQASQVKDNAMAKAADVKDTAVERGSDVVEVAKDEFAQLADEARDHVQRLWSQTSDQVREQADNGRRQLADLLHSLSSELGEMASKSTQDGPVTALAKQAAARGGELSHWLSNTEPTDMLTEVRRFARRRPWVFLGGAALAGVLVGRLGRGLAGGSQDTVGSRGTTGSLTSAAYAGGAYGTGTTSGGTYGTGSNYGTSAGTGSTYGMGAPYGAGSTSGAGSTVYGGQPTGTTGGTPYGPTGTGISGDLPDGELR